MADIESPIVLMNGDDRLTTFPINRKGVYGFYTDASLSYWTPGEISFAKDSEDWPKLSPQMQHCIKSIVAFFAASDAIVNVNIMKRFRKEIPILEVRYFYEYQVMIENVHAITYSMSLDSIVPEASERDRLLNAVKTIPIVGKMSQYMFRCIASNEPFAKRILRMACVEGVFFTGCFCIIYWLQSRGLMPGLGHANELIARDEGLHTVFALFLYDMIRPELKLSTEEVHQIFEEAVEIAVEFIRYALPEGMPEMNATLMTEYVKYCADNLIVMIGHPERYKAVNDFHFMDQINMKNRTNFFERRVGDYSKVAQGDSVLNEIERDF